MNWHASLLLEFCKQCDSPSAGHTQGLVCGHSAAYILSWIEVFDSYDADDDDDDDNDDGGGGGAAAVVAVVFAAVVVVMDDTLIAGTTGWDTG